MGIFYNVDTDGDGKADRRVNARGLVALVRNGARVVAWRPRPAPKPVRITAIAASQLHVRERGGDNRGEQVQRYQASTTVPGTGWPWCVAFVRWVWDRAGVHKTGYRGAYVPHLEFWAKKAGKWRSKPSRGAAVIFDWNRDGVGDHVGIVEQVSPIVTIEGNTTAGAGGDQSNGGGVYRRRDRKSTTIRGYVAV